MTKILPLCFGNQPGHEGYEGLKRRYAGNGVTRWFGLLSRQRLEKVPDLIDEPGDTFLGTRSEHQERNHPDRQLGSHGAQYGEPVLGGCEPGVYENDPGPGVAIPERVGVRHLDGKVEQLLGDLGGVVGQWQLLFVREGPPIPSGVAVCGPVLMGRQFLCRGSEDPDGEVRSGLRGAESTGHAVDVWRDGWWERRVALHRVRYRRREVVHDLLVRLPVGRQSQQGLQPILRVRRFRRANGHRPAHRRRRILVDAQRNPEHGRESLHRVLDPGPDETVAEAGPLTARPGPRKIAR